MSTGSRPGAAAQRTPPSGNDAGFSLLEVMVAISLIHVMMIALTTFYVNSGAVNHHQGLRQQASRVTADAMEKVRALDARTLLKDRDRASVLQQLLHPEPGVADYLKDADPAWHEHAADGAGKDAPVPTSAKPVPGSNFEQNWYVVKCWLVDSSTDCKAANKNEPTAMPFLRVVVAVTWRDKECAGGTCVIISSTLLSTETDPNYNFTPPRMLIKPDIYFLADTTGSMGKALKDVADKAGKIITRVDEFATQQRYGAGQYKDFPVQAPLQPFAYRNDTPIPATDDNGAAAKAAFQEWKNTGAKGGGDLPEANLFALHKLVSAAKFREGSTRIVVWFGDAPGHDPVCPMISGEANTVTEASVTAELVAANIQVIAISTNTGPSGGLDGNPRADVANNYPLRCGVGGKPGQGSRIAAATGGLFYKDVDPDDVANKIIAGVVSLR
ncbi:prepilin-type N-terminal cleavage/methylation domain-containing protein [Actinoplanes sp. NPDC051346]|uniref:prepilin-type N-terminal cleavage/methylation domain-containing protein n=1 Tax=Actinoplanes sp. NPDC051346 TaxID=3155048 RepID=UPI003440E064